MATLLGLEMLPLKVAVVCVMLVGLDVTAVGGVMQFVTVTVVVATPSHP